MRQKSLYQIYKSGLVEASIIGFSVYPCTFSVHGYFLFALCRIKMLIMNETIYHLRNAACLLIFLFCLAGCEELDDEVKESQNRLTKATVAKVLSSVPIGQGQMKEVRDAVTASSENGYDEEYLMRDLFSRPGTGVGNERATKSVAREYEVPLRNLIENRVKNLTKSTSSESSGLDGLGPEEWLRELENSDMQIYWPYSEEWNGKDFPTITYDPDNGSDVNIGWRITDEGVEEVMVDEDYALEHPVWVVNSNEDSCHLTLELLRQENSEIGEGGEIIVNPSTKVVLETPLKTLMLKEFKMKEHYDSWFRGASEFFLKLGSVEDFTASTEAELKLYSPSITDFMVVVKRKEKGKSKLINTILVSEWSEQLTSCAFMIVEDDGGTRTSWKCEAVVKYNSKSYGFNLDIPFNSRDDIIWRGELSARYIETYETEPNNFGNLELIFEFI